MSAVAPEFRLRRSVTDRRLLVVPGVTIVVVLFLVPVGFLIRQSIVGPQGSFTLAHYGEFFGEALYQRVLVRTAVLNAIVALIAAALAYPATLYLATRAGASARILLGLLTLPLLVGGTSLAYGWVIMFSRSGPLDRMAVSLFGGSNFVLINSEAGIVIGLVHILLPFMTFSLLASYDRLDWNAVRAARSHSGTTIVRAPVRICKGNNLESKSHCSEGLGEWRPAEPRPGCDGRSARLPRSGPAHKPA